jgi:DNA polymerase V
VKRIDLNEVLIRHPEATYYLRVRGHSMRDAGIADGDVLLVDRLLPAQHGPQTALSHLNRCVTGNKLG